MSVAVIIPARYNSTRFPGKPLANLVGIPLIQYVFQRVQTASRVDHVVVATDSEEIYQAVEAFQGRAVITSSGHPSGTDRIAEVARKTGYDIIVNVQGDEPLITGEMIDDVVSLLEDERADMGTVVKRIVKQEEIFNPNVVKAVFDREGFALYFSRFPVPYYRDEFTDEKFMNRSLAASEMTHLDNHLLNGSVSFFKHIGIYSYRRDVLLGLTELPQTSLEKAEKLEQLRALENGYAIKVKETESETIGVDTPEDLERVKEWLSISS
jgi:3-deoxy-manno-octulosonate cytidylyltransferase (CMP-KDO synthetase)